MNHLARSQFHRSLQDILADIRTLFGQSVEVQAGERCVVLGWGHIKLGASLEVKHSNHGSKRCGLWEC